MPAGAKLVRVSAIGGGGGGSGGGGGNRAPTAAGVATTVYERLVAVARAAKTGDPLLIRIALEHLGPIDQLGGGGDGKAC